VLAFYLTGEITALEIGNWSNSEKNGDAFDFLASFSWTSCQT